jgi:two-component sensor histidine kinase
MAFHELITNAGKHGALRAPAGRLQVTWSVARTDDECAVELVWRERGVTVSPNRTRGFGIEMIEETLTYGSRGSARVLFHADGIECQIRFPLPAEPHGT